MDKYTNKRIEKELKKFIKNVNNKFKLKKVILFGSHAKGTASVYSDIDVAIIFEGVYEEIKLSQIVRKIEQQLKAKIQVHNFTVKGFSGNNVLVHEIKRDGIDLTK